MSVPQLSGSVPWGLVLFRWRNFFPIPAALYALGLQRWGPPHPPEVLPLLRGAALFLAVVGLAVRGAAVGRIPPGTSTPSTVSPSAASLNTDALYSVVRHPLYLGNFLLWLSVAVLSGHPEAIAYAVLVFWLCYDPVMRAEEDFLERKFPSEFQDWAAKVPRLRPRLSRYRAGDRSFRIGSVLRREIHTVYVLVGWCALVEWARASAAFPPGHRGSAGWWAVTLAAAAVLVPLSQGVFAGVERGITEEPHA